MTTHCILERFELVTDTPGNIPLLRRFIIDLAIRGKLIEKDNRDKTATEILIDIAAKKELLSKDGKAKKQKPLLPITAGDIPAVYSGLRMFERLANIATIEKGLTGIQSAKPGEYPLVVTAEGRASCDHFDFEGAAAIIPMVSSTGHGHASLNRLHYQEGKFALGNILCAVFPISADLISARFIYEYLTAFKDELLVSQMIGTANVSLTMGKIGDVPIPIISPNVQQRVDELMALCDRLEATQTERESRRDRLVASSLHHLNNGADADAFRGHARFYFNHLPRLTTRPDHIKQLRQTIRNLAVRGKLVPQDPADEMAIELLNRIAKKQPTRIDGLTIPDSWKFPDLKQVAIEIVDCPHSTPKWTGHGKICVRTSQFRPGFLDLTNSRYVNEEIFTERIQRLRPQKDDILYSREGGILGVACRVPPNVDLCLGQRMMLIRPHEKVAPQYLELVLNSPLITDIARAETTGGAAPRINVSTVKEYPIPLPPLAEQHRIVAKVDELMALCDQLETQLTTTQTESRHLLEALLHHALSA